MPIQINKINSPSTTKGPQSSTSTTSPSPGDLTTWDDYQKRIQQAASSTRETAGGTDTARLKQAASQLAGPRKAVAESAISNFKTQSEAQKQQAEKAASALEMVGESTQRGVQNLTDIQSQIRSDVQSASKAWSSAAEKADEYVQASRSRVSEVLDKLDQINQEFSKERSFAKAHAMQASVQAALGSMKAEERNIAENYGTESKEYQQFQQSKMQSLATVQSNIHASYEQLAEQQHQTYLNAVSEAYTKSNMYLGFQEQQHVEMLKYSDQAKASYTLQASQLDASIEQMKMSGMENVANWIVQTPSFSMDMTPLATLISDLVTTQETERQAAELTSAQASLLDRQNVWHKAPGSRPGSSVAIFR